MSAIEGLVVVVVTDTKKERRSNIENSEDERRRIKNWSLKKKVLNTSTKITHSLKKHGKRKVDFRTSSVSIEDVRDVEEERAVYGFHKELMAACLLPEKHDDYHMLLSAYFSKQGSLIPRKQYRCGQRWFGGGENLEPIRYWNILCLKSWRRFFNIIRKDTMELTGRGDQSISRGSEKLSQTSSCKSLQWSGT